MSSLNEPTHELEDPQTLSEKEKSLETPEEHSVLNKGVARFDSEKGSDPARDFTREDDLTLVNGEPVIVSGRDVSRFVVDLRDDEDPALTFRSMFLGTLFAGKSSALKVAV
jgi:hypothetical protein